VVTFEEQMIDLRPLDKVETEIRTSRDRGRDQDLLQWDRDRDRDQKSGLKTTLVSRP